MNSALRHIAVILVIALHLFSTVAVEYAHHHGHAPGSSSIPAFNSHDCGANERHLPIDGRRVCALCVYSFSLAVVCIANPAASNLPAAQVPPVEQAFQHTDFHDLFHSGKRGPPAA